MIEWVVERALQAGAERVIVATDDETASNAIAHVGAEVCMTSVNQISGRVLSAWPRCAKNWVCQIP